MNTDELKAQVETKIQEARDLIISSSPDVFAIDRLDGELTALMANANTLRAEAENEANTLKTQANALMEMIRSLRKIHESFNTERRMG